MINYEDPYTYFDDSLLDDMDGDVLDKYIESQREEFRASWAIYTDEDYFDLEDSPHICVEDGYISMRGIPLPNDADERTIRELMLELEDAFSERDGDAI